ncbi:MAG: lactate utilization protein [Dethiosulfatibacter sp.]|nr:lactate utilization protein [Dethiosulfatibacter sp.]
MTHLEKSYELKAQTVIKQFAKRNIEGYYCANKDEALKLMLSFIEEGKSISWGGSESLNELGIKPLLENGNYVLVDRDKFTGEERTQKMKEAFFSDYYLTSSNAVSQDGMLVNIDGNGNRVAAMSFGPKNVIIVVGMNKIVPTVENAVERVRNFATPPNTIRLGYDTPCNKSGVCSDCLVKDCVCGQILITRFNRNPGRIKVIIVGETLGF